MDDPLPVDPIHQEKKRRESTDAREESSADLPSEVHQLSSQLRESHSQILITAKQ